MARLPTFQEAGIISADVPRLEFANTREQTRASQSLSENLERISQFAFGEAERKRKEENKILGIQLRADLELEAQQKFDELSGMIDRNELPYDQAVRQVQSMQGYARGLAQVDPEQASGLMRSISTAGNALLRKSAEIDTAKYAADIDVKSAQLTRTLGKNLETVWGLYRNGQMTEDEVLQYEAGARGVITGMASQSKDAVRRYLGADGAFEKTRIAARTSAFTQYLASPQYATDEITALNKMSSNDFGAFTNIASTLNQEEIKAIKKSVTEEFVARSDATNRTNAQVRAQNDVAFTDAYREFVDPKTPLARKNELRAQLFRLADTTEEVDRIINMPSASRDPLLFSNLREQIFRREITDIRQLQKYVNVLSRDELNQLQTQFMSADLSSEAQANRDINRYAGVPDNAVSTFNPKDAAYVKGEAVRNIYNGLVKEARSQNALLPPDKIKPIDYEGLKDKAIAQYEASEKKNNVKNEAKTFLENFSSEKKLKTPITENTSIDDLRKTKKFTESELEEIKAKIDILKGVR